MVDKKEFSAEAEKDKNIVEDKTINHENILIIVEQLLKDKVVIEEIMNKIEKGTTEEEYDLNRSKRIDLLLIVYFAMVLHKQT